jgi:hypothetical protein
MYDGAFELLGARELLVRLGPGLAGESRASVLERFGHRCPLCATRPWRFQRQSSKPST